MGKRGERKLKQLYDLTKRLTKPEITPVLEGCYRIQGPVDEEELRLQRTKSFELPVYKKSVAVDLAPLARIEAGSCNVCSAPCSSCMHANKSVSVMESNSEGGCFGSRMNKRKEADNCSCIDGNELQSKESRRCDNQQATSETSNLLSASSSHDSFSGNAESKATLKASAAFDVDTTLKASSVAIVEKQMSEDHGDNISSLTGSRDGNAADNIESICLEENNVTFSDSTKVPFSEGSQEVAQIVSTLGERHHGREAKQPEFFTACTEDNPQRNTANQLPPSLSVDNEQLHDPDDRKDSVDDSSPREKDTNLNRSLSNLESQSEGHSILNNGCDLKHAQSSNPEGEDQTANERSKSSSGTSSSNILQLGNKSAKDVEIDALECHTMDEIPEKLGSSMQDSNIPETQRHPGSNSEKEISESELGDDLKVCDICGDAGREECLAICSKCTDGAEHIYCMRLMMEKVPKGEWLCEDCKIKEQTENQKVNTSELLPGNSKPSSSIGKSEKNNDAHPKILPKVQKKMVFSEDRGVQKGSRSLKTSSKKHSDFEVASENGKNLSELSSIGSPKNRSVLSRESSFKNSDKGRGKPGNMSASYGSHSAHGSQALVRSQVHSLSDVPRGQQKLPTSRDLFELFSKSSSFNSSVMKRKVKQLTDDIPLNQKLTKDCASKDTRKEGQARTLTKSTSLKGPSYGRVEAMAKGPNSLCVEDQKDLKQGKEWSILGKKNSFTAERSVSISPKPGTAVCAKSEFKAAQNEGKAINMVEANESIVKVSEEANDLGSKQIKRQLSSLEKSQNPSSNGACINESHRPTLHRSISQAAEAASYDNKGKDYVTSNISRQAGLASGRVIRCQKCNETGHTSQYCSIDKVCTSALKPPAERISKEGNTKSNKWKEIVASAAVRARIQSSKLFDRAKETSISSTDLSSNTKDLLPNSLSFSRNLSLLDGRTDGQGSQLNYLAQVGNKVDVNQQVGTLSCIPNSGEFSTKPFTEKLPARSLLGSSLNSSVIPEFSFIWQGNFEVHTDEGIPEICDGLQAHLSSCASLKVLSVVEKFPCNLKLEELPRQCLWPSQFERNRPKEDNIALFFFAKDIESYERNYKKLLDKILGNDLALKGNINGVDLLIFPSSVLPEKFQRWNMLYFLWGIFREKRMDNSEDLHRPQRRNCISHLDVKPFQDASSTHTAEIPFIQKPDPCNSSDNLSAVSIKLSKTSTNYLAPPDVFQCVATAENGNKIYVSPGSLIEASSCRSSDNNKLPPSLPPCSFPDGSSKSVCKSYGTCRNQNQSILQVETVQRLFEPKTDVSYTNLSSNSKCRKPRDSDVFSFGKNNGLAKVSGLPTPDKDEGCLMEEQIQVKTEPATESNTIESDNLICHRGEKCSFSGTKAVSQVSYETSRSINETPDMTCFIREERQDHKKIKLCKYEEIFSNMSSSNVRPLLPSLNESHLMEDIYDADMVLQTSGTAEPKLFPVNNGSAINVKPHNFIDIVSSDDDEQQEATPDLELGLGKKYPTEREALPLLLPLDRNIKQEKLPADDGDDVSASLSLSLAFPDSEKDRKSEPLLPGQSCRNNSMLLFGGYREN